MAEHNDTGKLGEELAKNYLLEKGYIILKTNFQIGKNEIDIVCKDCETLVFVEVKTRHSDFLVEPEFAVTRKKQSSIIKAANQYIEFANIDCESRFDIISVIIHPDKNVIEHIDDAFSPILK
jgi:putative endonuclease